MSTPMERAKQLRNDTSTHYNCAQSVLLPFAEAMGIPAETALGIAANFGSGMKMGSVCGAVTGGLMALGLMGIDDPALIREYYRRLRAAHPETLDCAGLLRISAEAGEDRKSHCDAMVYECVELAEELSGRTV